MSQQSTINWSLAFVVDTAQTLLTANPVLLAGQLGIETDSQLFKVGDGTSAWVDISYTTINNQQSVWMGASTEPDNILARSNADGGLIVRSTLFMSAAEHIQTLNGNGSLNALDVSDPLKAALYRITVLTKSVIDAMGADFAALKTAAYTGTTVQQRIAAIVDQVTAVQGIIDDNQTVGTKTWSSTKINQMISAAANAAIANLVGAAPDALNTIYELAAAFSNNSNLIQNITNELGTTIRFDRAQSLTTAQMLQARQNIGAASSTLLGDYSQIDDKTLLQHFTESMGASAPMEVTVGEYVQRLGNVELRTHMNGCSMYKTGLDSATGQYLVSEWKRQDATLAMRSTLSSPSAANDGLYMTRTEQYYAATGSTLIKTMVYALTYDNNRNVISEVITSSV